MPSPGRGRPVTVDLLAALDTARAQHHDLHHPAWTDFGITAATTATGKATTTIWHGHPDSGTSWTAHAAPTMGAPS